MIQIYADGVLAFDSRLEEYDLIELKTTTGLNKGGTAEIVMPPYHPAYSLFIGYKTVVEIYRDDLLRFRGRALYPVDDYDNCRTIVCEGEFCFFQDAISRPYLYQADPAVVFTEVIAVYNSQVEDFKQFKVGTITVTDPNGYIRLEAEDAETVMATLDKLLERCGGYIVFTNGEDGSRLVHWLADVGTLSGQTIEVGENLFDVSRSGANTSLATALVPYGAKDETTGKRLTIESVNDGKDYIKDEAAAAIRGTIFMTATWDDVTQPENLLRKAQAYLDERKMLVTSLKLSALDLSYVDKSVDSYEVGDRIHVHSNAHKIDDDFQLIEQSEDWLNPANSTITLGKEISSLTSLDVAGDDKSLSALQKTVAALKKDYEINNNQTAELTYAQMVSMIEQSETDILLAVSKTYVTGETLESELELLAGSITMEVSGGLGGKANITLTVDGSVASAQELDLSDVRQAFADDTTAVTISAGTITFNSGTLIINSSKCQLTAAGKLTVEDAVVNGEIITIDGSYKTELNDGSLKLYYQDALCGTINTKYWSGASTEGISLRIEEAGSYIMFSHPSDAGSGYDVDYYLNYGWSDYYEERHIFQTSARFLDDVWLQRSYHRALYLVNGDGTFLVAVNSNGTGLTVSKI